MSSQALRRSTQSTQHVFAGLFVSMISKDYVSSDAPQKQTGPQRTSYRNIYEEVPSQWTPSG